MAAPICIECGADHDYDLAPDTGKCIVCGGLLAEPTDTKEDIDALGLLGSIFDDDWD